MDRKEQPEMCLSLRPVLQIGQHSPRTVLHFIMQEFVLKGGPSDWPGKAQKEKFFNSHDSTKRVVFSDLRNLLLSVSINIPVWVGDTDSEQESPAPSRAHFSLGDMPRNPQFLVRKLLTKPSLSPNWVLLHFSCVTSDWGQTVMSTICPWPSNRSRKLS